MNNRPTSHSGTTQPRGSSSSPIDDGTTERFRDNPARHLVVEPDLETGELRPAVKYGRPVYIYLCREQREP